MKKAAAVAVVALAVAAAAGASTTPLVPAATQQAIKAKAGSLAYVPVRAPSGWRYLSYTYDSSLKRLSVRVHDKHYATTNTSRTATFTASYFGGTLAGCGDGKQKTIQYDGNKVYWDDGLAWRCVSGAGGKIVKLATTNAILPDVALALIVASGKRVR